MGIFLRMERLRGESSAPGYEGWVECDSLQWGFGRAISTQNDKGERAASDLSVSEITLTQKMDACSPALLTLAQVEHGDYAEIQLTEERDGRQEAYMIYRLKEVMISQYSAVTDGGRARESVSLNYTQIDMEYRSDKSGCPSTEASCTLS